MPLPPSSQDANYGIRSRAGEGFIKGTRAHTKDGLKPIEEIKVGDYVLSKPESGEGEVAYKRVVRTVKWEGCETWLVSWFDESLHEEAAAKREVAAILQGWRSDSSHSVVSGVPKLGEIEGQLPVMLDREEIDGLAKMGIEQQVVL